VGWVIAAVAGVIAGILTPWYGNTGMVAAVLVGLLVFVVFGILLGMFWSTPSSQGDHVGHGHDAHGHDDHAPVGHSDPTPPAAASPIAETAPQPAAYVAAQPAPLATPVAQPEPTAQTFETPAPVMAPVAEVKPVGLPGPRAGKPDDLQIIEGIGPVLEKLCHELGIYHFDQIAGWGAAETAWMDGNLKGFKGRVTRDKWVRQAALIGAVGIEEFQRRAKTNDY
jgi:predicted flap endonuclease-1-like 5' DNA nuclease